jgi:hypothetical protein
MVAGRAYGVGTADSRRPSFATANYVITSAVDGAVRTVSTSRLLNGQD